MTQTGRLLSALKQCLRARGLTYRDLAAELGLSESSVKRLFSEQTFSLQRLEDVCRVLDMTIYELSRLAAAGSGATNDELSQAQEEALAEDPRLLAFFYLLTIGWKAHRIRRRLAIDERNEVRCLSRLQRLGLIEVMPRKRVRLLTDTRIRWSAAGPIRRRYENRVKHDFVDYAFDAADDALNLEYSELSEASITLLRRRIEQLAAGFQELAEVDRHLPPEEKRGFAVLLAARQWTFWDSVVESERMRAG
ncbi:MAG: helix-turn-helix transcriptional regulator [Pseudomonadota bacterium]